MTTLSPLQQVMLKKYKPDGEKNEQRDKLSPGKYNGEFLARIKFSATIGKDSPAAPTTGKIPWQKIAVQLAARVNESTLANVMDAALAMMDSAEAEDGEEPEVDPITAEQEARIRPYLKVVEDAAPKGRRGQVRATVIAELVTDPVPSPHRVDHGLRIED